MIMGEVVGAGLIAHVPTIVLPEDIRRELNNGEDTTLVAGLHQLRREVFETLDYDTVVVLDSHWATTVEFVVTAQERRKGLFTSEELPRGMSQRPYDFLGDPELAELIASKAKDHATWITAIADDHLPIFYATTNLWEFLGQGFQDKRWISIGVCQTADTEDNLRLGRALGDAIADSDRKVVLLASGALSHTFWPLRELRKHEAAGIEHIFTPDAAAADAQRMQWFEAGDHGRVLDKMPEF
jgi:3,4-dihydroxyphenylacetate 2,3-dioxygenase